MAGWQPAPPQRIVWATVVPRSIHASMSRPARVPPPPAGLALPRRLAGPVRDCHRRQLGHLPAAQQRRLIALLHAARLPHEDPEHPWGTDALPARPRE